MSKPFAPSLFITISFLGNLCGSEPTRLIFSILAYPHMARRLNISISMARDTLACRKIPSLVASFEENMVGGVGQEDPMRFTDMEPPKDRDVSIY
ncbi:hypothetical protein VNO80_10030 [Phaseolus coccineus]|uniref:Uncharacterized protein n=1 Tax=Phaseolus coccineus TaxID=3886 RepID=A0AAN9NCN6_PHACN